MNEDVLDALSLNSISYIRIPPGICLTWGIELYTYGIELNSHIAICFRTVLEREKRMRRNDQ